MIRIINEVNTSHYLTYVWTLQKSQIKSMKWPKNRAFAFTIIDDTDNSTLSNISKIYEHLNKLNIKTTKTVWVCPPRDSYTGQTLQDQEYREFLVKLQKEGFEIQLHNVGSGDFKRQEILKGLTIFKEKLGRPPTMQINHANNMDNLYWGHKRYGIL